MAVGGTIVEEGFRGLVPLEGQAVHGEVGIIGDLLANVQE